MRADEIWLPAGILIPDGPGSSTAELVLRIRVPMPADPTVPRAISLASLLADAELLDCYDIPALLHRDQP